MPLGGSRVEAGNSVGEVRAVDPVSIDTPTSGNFTPETVGSEFGATEIGATETNSFETALNEAGAIETVTPTRGEASVDSAAPLEPVALKLGAAASGIDRAIEEIERDESFDLSWVASGATVPVDPVDLSGDLVSSADVILDEATGHRSRTTTVESWLVRAARRQENLADLESLLQSLAKDRVAFGENTAATSSTPVTDTAKGNPSVVWWNDGIGGMILLETGSPTDRVLISPTAFVDEAANSPQPWSAAIGFFDAFEGPDLGHIEDVIDRAADVQPLVPMPPLELPDRGDASTQSGSEPIVAMTEPNRTRAAGVIACVVGVHYLRSRRTRPQGLGADSRGADRSDDVDRAVVHNSDDE